MVTLDEILARMAEYRPLVEIPHARSETARRYRFDDGVGEIGIIAPVSHPFCGHCSRIRITSDGKIRTCLFSVWDHDLHAQMQRRRQRRGVGRIHPRRRGEEGRAAPHRRAGFCAGIADHGAYRGIGSPQIRRMTSASYHSSVSYLVFCRGWFARNRRIGILLR